MVEKNITKATCCKYLAQMLQTHLIERWTRFDNFNKFASNFRCHIQYIRYISSCLRIFGKFFFWFRMAYGFEASLRNALIQIIRPRSYELLWLNFDQCEFKKNFSYEKPSKDDTPTDFCCLLKSSFPISPFIFCFLSRAKI